MLFQFKNSNKRIIGLGISLAINLVGFIAFTFFFGELQGLGIIFFGTFIMNLVLLFQQFRNRPRFEFFENEIRVHTMNETKTLSAFSLIMYHSFLPSKQSKEYTYLVTSEGEYQFIDDGDANYELVRQYLSSRADASPIAKYYFHLALLKQRAPSMVVSLSFLLAYVYYFDSMGLGNLFFKIFLIIQAGTLLIYLGQWIYYKRKLQSK